MNLHGIVSAAIGTVNPFIPATITPCTGYVTGADGTPAPTYGTPVTMQIQVQALTEDDLQKIEGLNIQSDTQAIYLNGNWAAIERADRQGGDLVTYNGQRWLVTVVSEEWPDWCRLIVTRQL